MADFLSSLSAKEAAAIITEIKDYQLTHGSLIKLVGYEDPNSVPSRPIGVSLFPTKFPRKLFDQACYLAPIFNKLYAIISEDQAWLACVLKDLIENDPLTSILWDIYQTVKHEGYAQDHVLGIFRSDYMLHTASGGSPSATLKQVEFNAYSCAGGTHSKLVSDMHHHLARKGAYGAESSQLRSMPRNETVQTIVCALEQADGEFGSTLKPHGRTCVLFVVQPFNINICDERPLEYALWGKDIPAYRVVFGHDVLSTCRLSEKGELFFKPCIVPGAAEMEVSVVYMRAGYNPEEYDEAGKTARLLLERSRAIKCPSIGCHLATLKKVQQELSVPGTLSRFLSPEDARQIGPTFMPLHPLDDTEEGLRAQQLALDPQTAVNHVLKPSLEGGGHNIYREAISGFLAGLPHEKLKEYILMECITPPGVNGALVSWRGQHHGPVISELGIFGTCLWSRSRAAANHGQPQSDQPPANSEYCWDIGAPKAAWSFKTKPSDMDEMSVVKSYGAFDSPLLTDD